MMAVVSPFEAAPLCSVCHKRPATKLCDFPIGRTHYVGHPPRYLMQQAKSANVAWKKVDMYRTITCNKLLCDACSIQMGNDIDFCTTHIEDMQIRKVTKECQDYD